MSYCAVYNYLICLLFGAENMACKRGGRELPGYYEQSRSANIAENERKMRGLINLKKNLALGENRRQIAEVGSLSQPPKKKKVNELHM